MDSGVITIMEKSKFNQLSRWFFVCLSAEYKSYFKVRSTMTIIHVSYIVILFRVFSGTDVGDSSFVDKVDQIRPGPTRGSGGCVKPPPRNFVDSFRCK